MDVPNAFLRSHGVTVKAITCELPNRLGVPLSRLYVPDIVSEVVTRGIEADVSGTTVWRWLSEDAIRPWRDRSWIFPRDPDFEAKAARVLDLYARLWECKALGKHACVISADEKTSIPARIRCHPTLPGGGPRRPRRARVRPGAAAFWSAAIGCRLSSSAEPYLVLSLMTVMDPSWYCSASENRRPRRTACTSTSGPISSTRPSNASRCSAPGGFRRT